jgi:hypothetical protein
MREDNMSPKAEEFLQQFEKECEKTNCEFSEGSKKQWTWNYGAFSLEDKLDIWTALTEEHLKLDEPDVKKKVLLSYELFSIVLLDTLA